MTRNPETLLSSPIAAGCLTASRWRRRLSVPEIPFDSAPNLLRIPANIHLGEAAGVATNAKGTRVRLHPHGQSDHGAREPRARSPTADLVCFEFDQNGKFRP